jgi:hypothetical protein
MSVVELRTSNGPPALIDAADLPLVAGISWFVRTVKSTPGRKRKPYSCVAGWVAEKGARGRTVFLHRLIVGAERGQIVDHINRDTLDNRRCNLRFATPSESGANRSFETKWGFKGIFKHRSRFYAQVRAEGCRHVSRSWATAEEAARAYDDLARRHHGDFAALNFPDHHPTSPEQPGPRIA